MEENLHHLNILGISFSIKSQESPEYINRVIEIYKAKLDEVKKKFPATEPIKIAMLSGLNLVDDLLKERRKQKKLSTYESLEIEKITQRIIERIDSELGKKNLISINDR